MAASVKRVVEMLVLGALADGPSHAYRLRKSIDVDLGHLHKMSDGMLYPLLKEVSRAGCISSVLEGGVNAPDRRVYRLEAAGRARLTALLLGPLESESFDDKADFYARYSLFKYLDPEQRERLLKERLTVCDRALERLSADTRLATPDPFRVELFERAVKAIESECEWLLERLGSGDALRVP